MTNKINQLKRLFNDLAKDTASTNPEFSAYLTNEFLVLDGQDFLDHCEKINRLITSRLEQKKELTS